MDVGREVEKRGKVWRGDGDAVRRLGEMGGGGWKEEGALVRVATRFFLTAGHY